MTMVTWRYKAMIYLFLEMLYNAGAVVKDIIDMGNGCSFTGNDGNIYEVEV